jgi:ketosteroid isomerase-like protein
MIKTVTEIAAEMADREAIRDCLYRYCRGIDRMDAELILSAYWPDAVDEHGNFETRSAQAFVDNAMPILRRMERTSHFIGNILIDVQGDAAFVETYIQAFHRFSKPDGTRYDNIASSRFVDRMERRDDQWRIAHRVVVRDWFREFADVCDFATGEMPTALGYGKTAPVDIGQRAPDDRSYAVLKPAT